MFKNTLVYGLSKDYIINEAWINEHYDVTGATDQDESRLPAGIGIKKTELKKRINDFDTILVCADPVSIVADLVDEFSVPMEKIQVLYYELDKSSKNYLRFYGNDREDAALLLLFEQLGYKGRDVRYLEIGTNDPVRFNNTYNFYLRNQNIHKGGTLVDPWPSVGYLASIIRPQDNFIQGAVSAESGGMISFWACKSSTVSSLNLEHHSKWDGQSHNEVKEIKVPLLGINDILSGLDYVPDFLLIDAEGEDVRIIRAIDFNRYRPTVIMIEIAHMDRSENDLRDFMAQKGYSVYAGIEQNIIFVLDEEMKKLR